MDIVSLLMMGFIAGIVAYYLKKDYIKGLCIAVFFLISLTNYLKIELGGGLPNLTVQRLILLLLLGAWVFGHRGTARIARVPFAPLWAVFVVANCLSFALSVDFARSLRQLSIVLLEGFAYYLIVATGLRKRSDAVRVLNHVLAALVTVAFFAFIERYTGFNPVDRFLPGYVRHWEYQRDILSTFPHRILLGTAVAAGFPIALAPLRLAERPAYNRILLGGSLLLLLSACYFAQSRGPWLSVALGGLVVFAACSSAVRRRVLGLSVAVVIGLALRRGVMMTLTDMARHTVDDTTFRGSTYLYRLELWKIAWHLVSTSLTRLFFGYGPASPAGMDIEWYVQWLGRHISIWTWDNHYAAYLVQLGVVGLVAALMLYLAVLRKLYRAWRESSGADRDTLACILASILILLFMRTNVYFFAPQLDYLFWGLAAVGCTLGVDHEQQVPLSWPGQIC